MNKLIASIKRLVRQFMTQFAKDLNKISGGHITPNMVTITGLIAHIYIAILIAYKQFMWAGGLLIIFGLFDALDGALARVQNKESKQGMLLDSVTDRLKEVILYAGITYAIILTGDVFYTVWVVLACGISLIVSYVNAWGEVMVKDTKHKTNKIFRTGFMTYDLRMLVLVIGLLSGYLKQAVIFIAIFAFWTACERFYLVTKKL